MQTDPIGYEDGMNWYAYVGNDPVNMVDPTGQFGEYLARELAVSTYFNITKAKIIAMQELQNRPRAHNDFGDAMRHATWNKRMVEETTLPTAAVWAIGVQHELEGLFNGQPMEEFWMDLNNNSEGRRAGSEGRSIDEGNLVTSASQGDDNFQNYKDNTSDSYKPEAKQQVSFKDKVMCTGSRIKRESC